LIKPFFFNFLPKSKGWGYLIIATLISNDLIFDLSGTLQEQFPGVNFGWKIVSIKLERLKVAFWQVVNIFLIFIIL